MKTVTRQVYYCEHCKRHRLTAHAILVHEPKCIYNPARSVCGWHQGTPTDVTAAVATLKATGDVAALRATADGCPACMLAVVVQARLAGMSVDDLHDSGSDELWWSYSSEVARYRQAERETERYAETAGF